MGHNLLSSNLLIDWILWLRICPCLDIDSVIVVNSVALDQGFKLVLCLTLLFSYPSILTNGLTLSAPAKSS